MKIDHIDVINLRFEYPSGRGFRYSGGICTARLTSLVLVHTDTGEVGVGSGYSHPGLVYLIIKNHLEQLLRGDDPREVETLWEKMYGLTLWYGRKGAALSALGALDVAFWDLRGKAAGKPVWQMLGGTHSTCPAYASALLWKDDLAELEIEAAILVAKGYRRVKMRMGRSEEYDIAAVRAVRKAIGPSIDLIVDAGMRYNVALARRVASVLEENDIFWFEEPFAPEDIESYATLRSLVQVPIAAGENEFGTPGFSELIGANAVDIVQPDASRCGGISETCRVAKMADDAGLRVATHTWSDAIAVTANAHVVGAMPNGLTVEIDQTGNPFIEELLVEPMQIQDGQLQLSKASGLGIEVNQKVMERLCMSDPLSIPDGRYSDMTFGQEYFTPAGPYQENR